MLWLLGYIIANIVGSLLCRKKLEIQYELLYQEMKLENPDVTKKSLIMTGLWVCILGFVPIYTYGLLEGFFGRK